MISNVTSESETPSIYDLVGGHEAFFRLVNAFYDLVEQDPVLRPLYPESLDEPRQHLALFLVQFFGGPDIYSQQRGHPRLRARHLQFKIGRAERDAWVKHMTAALDAAEIDEPAHGQMREYFEQAATFLVNE
jgi:hemoglobin